MKKNSIFKCWICLFALVATFALVGCSNDDDNNSGGGSQTTTVLSGKTFYYTGYIGLVYCNPASISFPTTGNNAVISGGLTAYGEYSINENSVIIRGSNYIYNFTYNASEESLYWEEQNITFRKMR